MEKNRYHNMSEEDKPKLLKNTKDIIVGLDKQHNYFICIFFSMYKMKPRVLSYGEAWVHLNIILDIDTKMKPFYHH